MTAFFGERWDAPIVEPPSKQFPTPVGKLCLECDEPIVDGDRGFLRTFMTAPDGYVDTRVVIKDLGATGTTRAVLTAIHRECDALGVVGHIVKVCSCTDYAGIKGRRQQAVEVDRRRQLRSDAW